MNLETFHGDISGALRRGSSLDTLIPSTTRQAALWLEQNYTFRYMKRFGRVTINPTATAPERIELESQRIKSWEFVKAVWTSDTGREECYWDLEEFTAKQMVAFGIGQPAGYYQDGDQFLVLDTVPQESLTLALSWNEYTTWPTSAYAVASPRLLVIGENALKYQTLLMMAADLRDPRLSDTYRALRDEHLHTFLSAEEEGRDNNRRYKMNYVPIR